MLSSGKLRPGKEKKEQPQLKLIYTEINPSRWWCSGKNLGSRDLFFFVVSDSSPVVVHMMATKSLHGR
jgi:hypothetical protein